MVSEGYGQLVISIPPKYEGFLSEPQLGIGWYNPSDTNAPEKQLGFTG